MPKLYSKITKASEKAGKKAAPKAAPKKPIPKFKADIPRDIRKNLLGAAGATAGAAYLMEKKVEEVKTKASPSEVRVQEIDKQTGY